ncbi:MAG TPA: long-chain fatty acid--CoA ligase [Cyanobacteria bacterium UBA11149]|nr:long-chain fatty acid--CoA ligase [Cyanobacteria bacterium UBA11367]HBE57899.1 long-chain fatty acid--CoA ligase [Cyanobacteria bacterium UBA11366]HBK65650.1 long-chain fatty acid--CoA ligase [Cyanobacteria bacterium UBA11166]HBR74846.1 long-chain fatty acid--CoA ligase [Cyanobacteria bacterium UBA11159]HBS69071.1 long-chain fatty acid--CoA ligase [Cyanobacteria bacterium UBA11153]HBW90954.1 long-chain fatty acid--CoA ligase [Cyanobacteria bacterium UBA11149]HCA95052.1 long-chain fatty aci
MNLPLIDRSQQHGNKIAIATTEGSFSYQYLLQTSAKIATNLLNNTKDLQEQRVAFLIPSGFQYVATQWGIWRAGGIAVPLCISHPKPELDYVIADSGASIIVAHPNFEALLRQIAQERNLRFILTSENLPETVSLLPEIDIARRGLIIYTSGTTGKPKGVVTTHQNIQAQITSLISAWEWKSEDSILHFLPLHHIHGIINVLSCALWIGAQCEMLTKFDAQIVWQRIIEGNLTLFMAVPTIYVKLIAAWEAADKDTQKKMSAGCAKMRLMVSGSAALPVQVLEKWRNISGHFLLERYGMTEIGMALSNPLHGERLAGYVGKPLPEVEIQLVDERGNVVSPGTSGEIQVKSPGVFLEYWQKPEATAKAFRDGWFCTGDFAVVENDNYRILGRMSVDIIKTGGYKVSALEIEEVLRTHPHIQECAVVGVADSEWGEIVSAALILQSGSNLSLETLRSWAKERLATYKVPTQIMTVEELPRNAMGKVIKPSISQLFLTR